MQLLRCFADILRFVLYSYILRWMGRLLQVTHPALWILYFWPLSALPTPTVGDPLQLLLHPHTHTSCIKQLEYGWLFKFEHSVCAFNLNFNLNFKPKCAMCVHLGQEIKEYIYVHIYI